MNVVATRPMLVKLKLSNIQVDTYPNQPPPITQHPTSLLLLSLVCYNLQHKFINRISSKQINAIFYFQVFTLVCLFTAFIKAQGKRHYC